MQAEIRQCGITSASDASGIFRRKEANWIKGIHLVECKLIWDCRIKANGWLRLSHLHCGTKAPKLQLIQGGKGIEKK